MHRAEPYHEVIEQLFNAVRDGQKQAFVSVVTELELLVRPFREGDGWEVEQVRIVLDGPGMHVVEMDRQVARMGAEIRAKRALSLADATIVATAVYANCDVIVGNDARCAQRVRDIPYVLLDELVKER